MPRFTEQTDGAKAHNVAQQMEARARDLELLERFERSGESVRSFATTLGVSAQRLSVRLRRARAARETDGSSPHVGG